MSNGKVLLHDVFRCHLSYGTSCTSRQGYGASIRLFKHAQIENGLSDKDTWACGAIADVQLILLHVSKFESNYSRLT